MNAAHPSARSDFPVRGIVSAMLLLGIALCPRLWFSSRSFPAVPLVSALPDLPWFLSVGLSSLLVAGLVAVVALPRPNRWTAVVLVTAFVLVLFDQNRLQPWFFQGMVLLTALCLEDGERSRVVRSLCAFIVAATYLWSGLQKANLTFGEAIFPWLLEPFGLASLRPLWRLAPIIETLTAGLLFLPGTRRWGVAMAILMHAFLLLALGPWGQHFNSVVWPWNVAMPLLVVALFWRNDAPILSDAWHLPLGKGMVILVGILPALNFFGLWDDALSFSLYSGKSRQGFLLLSPEAAGRLPRDVQPFVQRRPDRIAIDFDRWALSDLNVPPYAEERVYRAVARRLIASGVPAEGVRLIVKERPGILDSKSRFREVPLP